MSSPSDRSEQRRARGEAHARVRGAVRRILEREGSGMGLLLDGSGVVSAAAGNPGVVDPVTFASLAAAHALAAGALAPLAAGAEFSQLVQEGRRSRIVLASVGDDGVLALLTPGDAPGNSRSGGGGPDVTELNQALAGLRVVLRDEREEGVGLPWVQAAESQIDQIFRERR